jgi:hypothetical protein
MKTTIILSILAIMLFSACRNNNKTSDNNEKWISLFNGKNLDGWDIKIKGFPLGENYKNTFTVKDSMIVVSYGEYDKFENHFGHLYSKVKYSNYKLRLQYKFVGEVMKDAPVWTFLNSGVMLHSQPAQSIELNQDFPVSIEAQILGCNDTLKQTTLNVCTPGTIVSINGNPNPQHCILSNSKLFSKDDWVNIELVVYNDSIIHHLVNGDTVLTYTKPALIPGESFSLKNVKEKTPLKEGYIALQAEGQGIEFRNIEILDLSKKGK